MTDKFVERKVQGYFRSNVILNVNERYAATSIGTCLIIKKLTAKKLTRIDGVNIVLMKNLPYENITFFIDIFNKILVKAIYPKMWKQAKMITIPDPQKRTNDPANYHSISFFSILRKITKTIIFRRFDKCTMLQKNYKKRVISILTISLHR